MNILKNKSFLFFIFFTFLCFNLHSQTIITGKAGTFSGDSLFLYTYNDKITETPDLISETKVDKQGNFKFSFKITKTQRVFVDLPVFRAFLYVEPNKKYTIRIPAKQEPSVEQKINPFFQKEEIPAYVFIYKKNNLNYLIACYNKLIAGKQKLFRLKGNNRRIEYLDSIKMDSDTLCSEYKNTYFHFYKFYSNALLEYLSVQGPMHYYLDSFFLKTPVLFNNPAYNKLFNLVFNNYFTSGNDRINTQAIYTSIVDENFDNIKKQIIIGSGGKIHPELAELIAIKSLYESYFKYPDLQQYIIGILEQMDFQNVAPEISLIAKHFYNKIIGIRTGYTTPNFYLKNKRGRLEKLSAFNGDFIYLNFISPDSYACIEQLPILKKYNDNRIKKLKILTVFVADSIEQMRNFLKKHKEYKWTFLFTKYNSKVLKEYKIISFPTYFLLDPEGKLTEENTPSPLTGFERFYNSEYEKWIKTKKNIRFR